MKRCPECRRDYYDDSLSYCLDDGSALLEGPASAERPTAIFAANDPSLGRAGEAATQVVKAERDERTSIAVLPFVNMSADEENEYFCDGLAEELLNALSKIEELKVAARTSAFSFKGENVNAGEIGAKLGVGAILEGSVRRSGDRLRISVQLVNSADGFRVWSERYDTQMRDIFTVQDEIALAVVDALKLKLLGKQRSAVLKKGTDNAEAYEAYLRGRSFWNRRAASDFEKGIRYFEEAISLDPNYAVAYSGLADCYTFLGYFEVFPPSEVAPKAKAAVTRAIEIDDSFAEVHASLAVYKLFFEFDNRACEAGLRRAIELNPNFAVAYYWLSSVLAGQKRFDEAWELGAAATHLDPLSPVVSANIARAHCHAREYEKAIAICLKSLEIVPDFFFTEWVLGVAYGQTGRFDEAITYLEKAVERSGIIALRSDLGVVQAIAGRTEEARRSLSALIEAAASRYVSPLSIAKVYLALGDIENGWKWLDEASKRSSIQLLWLATEPLYDPIRNDPKFVQLMRDLNFPDSAFI